MIFYPEQAEAELAQANLQVIVEPLSWWLDYNKINANLNSTFLWNIY